MIEINAETILGLWHLEGGEGGGDRVFGGSLCHELSQKGPSHGDLKRIACSDQAVQDFSFEARLEKEEAEDAELTLGLFWSGSYRRYAIGHASLESVVVEKTVKRWSIGSDTVWLLLWAGHSSIWKCIGIIWPRALHREDVVFFDVSFVEGTSAFLPQKMSLPAMLRPARMATTASASVTTSHVDTVEVLCENTGGMLVQTTKSRLVIHKILDWIWLNQQMKSSTTCIKCINATGSAKALTWFGRWAKDSAMRWHVRIQNNEIVFSNAHDLLVKYDSYIVGPCMQTCVSLFGLLGTKSTAELMSQTASTSAPVSRCLHARCKMNIAQSNHQLDS